MIELKPEATRVAVIGAGYWGTNYIRIFGEFGDARVVAVCDSRADRLDAVRRTLPVRVTDDAAEAMTRPEADAVAIVTDASTHRRLAGMALEAGKHVLVEKPVTTTSKDASELIDLAERRGRTLMVGHTFLYNPGVRAVKEYLAAGEVGEVYYLYSQRTSLGPIRSDVNAIWDLAPHDIAILNYLLDHDAGLGQRCWRKPCSQTAWKMSGSSHSDIRAALSGTFTLAGQIRTRSARSSSSAARNVSSSTTWIRSSRFASSRRASRGR